MFWTALVRASSDIYDRSHYYNTDQQYSLLFIVITLRPLGTCRASIIIFRLFLCWTWEEREGTLSGRGFFTLFRFTEERSVADIRLEEAS